MSVAGKLGVSAGYRCECGTSGNVYSSLRLRLS
ncbi:unnamed protein product, partial [marine sediment metagenome]